MSDGYWEFFLAFTGIAACFFCMERYREMAFTLGVMVVVCNYVEFFR